jgi:type IX secretion system PorP/SprF family membrane protein
VLKVFFRYAIFSFTAIVLSENVLAQQDPQFSLYMLNMLYYNPAYAGIPGSTNFTAIHRSQWLGYTSTFDGAGAPNTQVISLNTPLSKLNSGVGLHIVNDNLGVINNLEGQASFAYHLAIKKSILSFGVRGGFYSQTMDFDKYRYIDPGDPLLDHGQESQMRPDLAAGLFFRAEKYYAGFSTNHIIQSEFDFGDDSLRNALESHMYLTGGFSYDLSYDIVLKPSFLVKTDLNTYSFELSLMATLRDRIWGGISYRQSDSMVGVIGYSFMRDDSFKVGYGFDYVINAQEAKQPTSHEFLLSYTLPVLGNADHKIIRTPRFRH